MWRRDGDSNPGYPLGVRQFSKLLLSATQAPLLFYKYSNLFLKVKFGDNNIKRIFSTYFKQNIIIVTSSIIGFFN